MRGTTNGNARGSNADRARRRAWLVQTYRADKDVDLVIFAATRLVQELPRGLAAGRPACRCYRCGDLMVEETLTVDRIIPGCRGGTYRRNNIRPACAKCNSETGGATRRKK